MLGYKVDDIDRMKYALNMASFYLPPAQEYIKVWLQEANEFLDGILAEGHIS